MPTEFQERVYRILSKVPKGKVTTYNAIAKMLGNKYSQRAVGNALNKNSSSKVKCHRVIKSDGDISCFASGVKNKIKLLKREGIKTNKNKVDLKKFGFKY